MTEIATAWTKGELRELVSTGDLLAGGTDLLVQLQKGRKLARLVDVSKLLDGPDPVRRAGGELELSALTPLDRLSTELDGALPSLDQSVALFGSVRIRNRATIGGNLGNASPAGDTIPPLVAADAVAVLEGLRRAPQGAGCRARHRARPYGRERRRVDRRGRGSPSDRRRRVPQVRYPPGGRDIDREPGLAMAQRRGRDAARRRPRLRGCGADRGASEAGRVRARGSPTRREGARSGPGGARVGHIPDRRHPRQRQVPPRDVRGTAARGARLTAKAGVRQDHGEDDFEEIRVSPHDAGRSGES